MQRRRRARFRTYPSPSLDLDDDLDHDPDLMTSCRHITFPADVRLQAAVQQQDNTELHKILVQSGPQLDLNYRNHSGTTVLHQGVLNRNLDTVKLLLGHGADANLPDTYGYSPLHTASACGLRNIASLLIIHGADLSQQTLAGDTPAELSKDLATADLLTQEFCRQVQLQQLIDKYGFAFRFIDLCELFWANCCLMWKKIIEWTHCALETYFHRHGDHSEQPKVNGKKSFGSNAEHRQNNPFRELPEHADLSGCDL